MENETKANLAALIESSSYLIWSVGLEFQLMAFNRATREYLGENFGATVEKGLSPWDLFPHETALRWSLLYERALEEGSFETEFPVSDDRRLELTVNPVIFDRKISGVSVFGKDISERKRNERVLLQNEKMFRLITESSPLAIFFSAGLEQRYTYANSKTTSLFGYKPDEVAEVSNWWPLVYPDAEYRRQVAEEWDRRVARAVETNSAIEPMETRVVCKDGSIRDILWFFESVNGQNISYGVDLTERNRLEHALHRSDRMAFYDPLTGLPNRRLLLERLHQALAAGTRSNQKRALLFCDLDDFKMVNDTLGHQSGDLLLQEVAHRLTLCLRESDTVARLGGDEFVIMLEGLSESASNAASQARSVGEAILAALSKPFQLAAHECRSSCSIGITVFGGHRGDRIEEASEVLKHADVAMYQAKAAGGNTMHFLAPALEVEAELR